MAIRKRWAFLVGINRYTDYSSLKYCVDDVLALEKLLTVANYTVVTLHDRLDRDGADGTPNRLYPSVDNIRAEFRSLCQAIRAGANQGKDDLLLVYFACHGTRCSDNQPRLVATDTRRSLLADRAISIEEIEAGLHDSGAGCKVLMLDACHIGLGETSTARAAANPELLRELHSRARGYALLTASTDQQKAHEWDSIEHGVFSFYTLSGLSGEADLGNKNFVTVGDLSRHIGLKMQEWAVSQGVVQIPQGRLEGDIFSDFPLIENYQKLQRPTDPSSAVDCLWSLDYDAQRHTFKENIPRSPQAAAFIIQAKDSRIQQWLVKRLVNQLSNIMDVENPRIFPFVVPVHPMWKRRDFSELWRDLARQLRCPDELDAVIDALVQIYRTKPIIIAMYGWSAMVRSQALQQQVLVELWQPLVEAIGRLETLPLRSRIILFLAEGHSSASTSTLEALPASDPTVPIRLDPLTEITSDHLAEWMESDRVYSSLSQLLPEDQLETLINEEILQWDPDPVAAIEQICYIFELENGIADIEADWRLAG